MIEIYCPFNGGELCLVSCPNYGHNAALDSSSVEGLAAEAGTTTIKSSVIPGHDQETKNANMHAMRIFVCEINNANKLFRRKKK